MAGWNTVGPWDEFARFILTNFPPPTEREKRDMATALVDPTVNGLNARIEELEAELAFAKQTRETFTPEEPAEEGSVVRFRKYNFGYTFAAIKVPNGRWYLTQDGSRSSRQGHAPKTWDELLTWIGERNWHRIEVLS